MPKRKYSMKTRHHKMLFDPRHFTTDVPGRMTAEERKSLRRRPKRKCSGTGAHLVKGSACAKANMKKVRSFRKSA